MSLFLLPSAPLYTPPAPSFLDNLLEDLDHIQMTLQPLQRSVARRRQEAAGCLDKIVDDENKLAITLNVGKFKPEELKVDLDGKILKIEGKQEIQDKNGYSLRTFTRAWALPDNIDAQKIKSSITEDGHLSIEAPKMTKPSITSKSIPIEKAPAKKDKK